MPSFVVKQPNGRLAIFSTVVDAFVCVDASRRELLSDFSSNLGTVQAKEKILRGVADQELSGAHFLLPKAPKGLRRWTYAVHLMMRVNPNALAEVKKLIPDCFQRGR